MWTPARLLGTVTPAAVTSAAAAAAPAHGTPPAAPTFDYAGYQKNVKQYEDLITRLDGKAMVATPFLDTFTGGSFKIGQIFHNL